MIFIGNLVPLGTSRINTAQTRTVVARVYIKPDSVMTRIMKAKGGCMRCLWSFIIRAAEAKLNMGSWKRFEPTGSVYVDEDSSDHKARKRSIR